MEQPENMEKLLEMRNITKEFPGVKALSDVNFGLRKGSIHGLVGENGAGKSTLMKVLTGTYSEYQGEVFLDGSKVYFTCERDALDAGISIVAQELNPVLELDIAQNVYLGKEPTRGFGILDNKKLYKDVEALLHTLNLDYNPTQKMKYLSVAQRQMVEIAKAISNNSRIIALDEPTSALTHIEAENLFKQLERLRDSGVSMVLITHKIDEIFRVCDTVSVMRDGNMIDTRPAVELSEGEVIHMMVGREMTNMYPPVADVKSDEIMLEVNGLSRRKVFSDVSFKVRKGEILGIAGMIGAGRSEIMRAIFGLDVLDGGEVLVEGKKAHINGTSDAIRNGIAMVTEDRSIYGFVGVLSIHDNIVLPNTDKLAPHLFIKQAEAKRMCEEICKKLNVKAASTKTKLVTLSGGNQQKVVLAKWLARDIKVLIMDEPTRGIDVWAKYEIYKLMTLLAEQGLAIIMISSEMPEVIGMSNRILVINEGKILAELPRGGVTQEQIMEIIVRKGA